MKYINYCISMLLLVPFAGTSQPVLSKPEAVETVLSNNYNIRLASNNVAIASNSANPAIAGFNPTVDASALAAVDLGNSDQEFADGREIKGRGTLPVSGNASVDIRYILYQGNARNLRLSQLQEQVKSASLAQPQTVELSILQLMINYYQVAQLSESVRALEQTLFVSQRRLERARYGFDYGQGSRLLVLNAEVDINRDSINLITAQQELSNAKRNVNVLLARDVNTPFEVDTNLIYADDLVMRELLDSAMQVNANLLLAEKELDLLGYDYELNETTRRPVIAAGGNLWGNFQSDLSNQSFINYSTQYGIGASLSMNWNLYDGGFRKIQRENLQLAMENQRIAIEQIQNELERDLRNAWEIYQNALYVLRVEQHNLETNRDNFQRTQEQYNIGQVTSVEFRQAQFNLLNAEINYSTAKYTAKVAELRLLQLCGRILDAVY